MERAGDRELLGPHARALGGGLGLLDPRQRPGEDELLRRVLVRQGQAVFGGERLGAIAVRADGEHAAGLPRAGHIGHDPAARHDDPQPVGVVDRSGGGEGADLTQRVAGEVLGVGTPEPLEARDRGAVDGGLGVGRALRHALEGILADKLGGELEQVRAEIRDYLAARRIPDPLTRKEDR